MAAPTAMTDTAQDTIHVAIVDDFPVILRGYEGSLANTPHIKIVGTALYGDELMPLLAQKHVDLLLLDLNVPISKENKMAYPIFHTIPQIIRMYPYLNVVVATMYADRSLIKAVIQTGVSGYILKDDLNAIQEFGAIITSIVRHNGRYWSPEVQRLLEQSKNKKGKDEPLLTPRQLQAISLCAAYPEQSTAQLAEYMCISDSTFRNHLTDAYFKLGVQSRGGAVAKARQLGLIVFDEPPSFSDLRGENDDM
jgi:DNA-binding NarL/FixJ family response regulator